MAMLLDHGCAATPSVDLVNGTWIFFHQDPADHRFGHDVTYKNSDFTIPTWDFNH
jgi:hypothetical protein